MSENELLRQKIALLEHENASLRQSLVALRISQNRPNTETPPMGEKPIETDAITRGHREHA